ncbi:MULTISPECIES: helix-turn-helix transcriptional regulator [Pantoea]|uniref:Helix-turn-helix domain-containing protein n=1 Tax=Pantoea ananas TaxID=553 RepID=A0A8A4JY64_PANAN|nr:MULTISPECIES: helix-turn-helix domain-containing protein [Pantoea]PQK82252.1 helix-turn-helix transcriptional regulator [Pantoea ananatis]PQK95420.1 helix-turn-helix transcriptional regulator [Pantoea ananatis]PQL08508.1 helix-turn-helix transcriptional regulator [Pantoea ananatis]PWW18502.1 regulatory LuxR family protein [Pantoea sp. AG702]QTC44635.1 helix-turn-helix domain-containing protein [Pantoea ananatis]
MLRVIGKHGENVFLTDKEIAVIGFYMTGMKLQQIACRTGMDVLKIRYHKRRVMRKLGVKNNKELILWFIANRPSFSLEERDG